MPNNTLQTIQLRQLRTLNFVGFMNGDIAKRAALIALVLGSILTVVNQFDAVFGNAPIDLPRLVLVFLTPFLVVTASQVFATRQAIVDAVEGVSVSYQSPLKTALSHGIPQRALILGLLAGSVNSAILTAVFLVTEAALPLAVLAQAFVLPVIFSLLSQTLTYRRTALSIAR